MKKYFAIILLISIIYISKAQEVKFDYKQNYAACVITLGTFAYIEKYGADMDPNKRAIVAYTGMGTAILSTFIYRGIKKYAYSRHRRCRVYW